MISFLDKWNFESNIINVNDEKVVLQIDVDKSSLFTNLPSSLVQKEIIQRLFIYFCQYLRDKNYCFVTKQLITRDELLDENNSCDNDYNDNTDEIDIMQTTNLIMNGSDDIRIKSGIEKFNNEDQHIYSSTSNTNSLSYEMCSALHSLAIQDIINGTKVKSLQIYQNIIAKRIGSVLLFEFEKTKNNNLDSNDVGGLSEDNILNVSKSMETDKVMPFNLTSKIINYSGIIIEYPKVFIF